MDTIWEANEELVGKTKYWESGGVLRLNIKLQRVLYSGNAQRFVQQRNNCIVLSLNKEILYSFIC